MHHRANLLETEETASMAGGLSVHDGPQLRLHQPTAGRASGLITTRRSRPADPRDLFHARPAPRTRVLLLGARELARVTLAAWLESDQEIEIVGHGADPGAVAGLTDVVDAEVVLLIVEKVSQLAGRRPMEGSRLVVVSSDHSAAMCAETRALQAQHVAWTDRADVVRRSIHSGAGTGGCDGAISARRVSAGLGQGVLSKREREVVTLLAQGLSAKQAAGSMSISPKTVDNHLQRLMRKLDIHSRADLVLYAVREGFVEA